MEFNAVFTVKKEFSKEDFLRELIIELGTQNDTPVDVVDAKFGEVKESVREVVVCTAHVTGTCTANIGYDRQEPYIYYETYREKVGDTYVNRQRAVTKYRTVTDWQFYKTRYAGDSTSAAYNTDKFGMDTSGIVDALKSVKDENVLAEGEAVVDSNGLLMAVADCELYVEKTAVKFPGDRHRDENFDSDYEIRSLSCYKMPYYEATYVYKGKKYEAGAFACGNINIFAQTPPNDVNITAVVKEKTAGLKSTMDFSWKLFTIAIIAAYVIAFMFEFAWLFPIPIVLLIKAKMDSDRYSKEYQKHSDNLSKNIATFKISAITKALEKRGYKPMDKELTNALKDCSVPGAEEPKSMKGRTILSWVLVGFLTFVSIITINLQ